MTTYDVLLYLVAAMCLVLGYAVGRYGGGRR